MRGARGALFLRTALVWRHGLVVKELLERNIRMRDGVVFDGFVESDDARLQRNPRQSELRINPDLVREPLERAAVELADALDQTAQGVEVVRQQLPEAPHLRLLRLL